MTVCYWCGAKDTLADVGKELDDGKYIMVKCKKCKTAYYVENKEKMMEKVQMTNEERFDSLTTGGNPPYCLLSGNKCFFNGDDFVDWLNQPHTFIDY